ncbi:MAG: hypothetical protein ABFD16_22915 [Thermoguttaceae bacterium]|jgi:hypothetical protein
MIASPNLLALYAWVYYVYRMIPWLSMGCGAILAAAALLHWQRTRHWCLLTMATGAILVILADLAMQITMMQLTPVALPSGTMKLDARWLTVWQWLVVFGEILVAIGGLGAIKWAIGLRQRSTGLASTPPAR